MTRPFGLHDLGLLWGLRGQGITLDMQRAVLWRLRPLEAALTAFLPWRPPESTLTFVCQNPGTRERGFTQVLTCPARQEWQVIHLAPWVQSEDLASGMAWVGTLVDLCTLAGASGALRIRAGVAAGGPEEEAFREAGFAPYTREEVYRLRELRPAPAPAGSLRPITPRDAWPLIQLVSQVVPSPVQHAEGMTTSGASAPILTRLGVTREQGFVLERGMELGAYVGLSRSAQGAWVRILLHPESKREADDVVRCLMAKAAPTSALYWAVRDYQAGLRGVLSAMGFELVGVQVWLVKHTTRPVAWRRYRDLVAREKRVEPVTTPLHPVHDVGAGSRSALAREHCAYEYRRRDGYAVGTD